MKGLLTYLVVMVAVGVSASTIILDTGSLPSTQGWEYRAVGVHASTAETDLMSTDGSVLNMNTMGQPFSSYLGSTALYRLSDVVQDSMPTVLQWTSRTLEHETAPEGYYGFFVGFRTDFLDYSAGIFPNHVAIRNGSGWIEIPIDASEYHTYRIQAIAGSPEYDFYIDDSLQASAVAKWNSAFENSVLFGDGTGRANANSDIASLAFGQFDIGVMNVFNENGCIEATGPNGATIHLSAEDPFANPSSTYIWEISTGESGFGDAFEFNLGVDQQASVTLTAVDGATGLSNTVTRTVCVSDTTAPVIEILSPESGEVYNGNNLSLEVRITDAVDQNISDCLVTVGKSYLVALDPERETSKIKLSKPGPTDGPIPADVIVTAADNSGNATTVSVEVLLQHDNRSK